MGMGDGIMPQEAPLSRPGFSRLRQGLKGSLGASVETVRRAGRGFLPKEV